MGVGPGHDRGPGAPRSARPRCRLQRAAPRGREGGRPREAGPRAHAHRARRPPPAARAARAPQLETAWALAEHWERAAPGRLATVLYEDLVAHPEAAVREVLGACGIGFEPRVLAFHEASAGAAQGVLTASQAQVRRPLYGGAVGRWRRYARQMGGAAARLAPLVERYERRLAAAAARRAAGGGGGGGGGDGGVEGAASRDEL